MMSIWKPSHKQNIWELSGQYEGDIMMNNQTELKNALVDEDRRWTNGILPYFIEKDFGKSQHQKLINLHYFIAGIPLISIFIVKICSVNFNHSFENIFKFPVVY